MSQGCLQQAGQGDGNTFPAVPVGKRTHVDRLEDHNSIFMCVLSFSVCFRMTSTTLHGAVQP